MLSESNVTNSIIMTEGNEDVDDNFDLMIKNNIKTLLEGIKLSNFFPVGSNRTNFLTCFPSFKKEISPHSNKLMKLISKLLRKEGFKTDIENRDIEEKVDLVVDGVNKILDRMTDNLNEYKGIRKAPTYTKPLDTEHHGSWNKQGALKFPDSPKSSMRFPGYRDQLDIPKPQESFQEKIDNSKKPFKPKLDYKPNALEPLRIVLKHDVFGNEEYNHPYDFELNHWIIPNNLLQKRNPIPPTEIDATQAFFVRSKHTLDMMMEDLKKQTEIAVDLEHHDRRSYLGFTCLIQISTRNQDYIVDALALRSEITVLNEVFTNSSIVKVLHGALSDIQWLQKDFSVYMVNLFDTFIVAKILGLPKLSLKHLLSTYCGVVKNSRFAFYDWRTRPLSQMAFHYARVDTHYLLYLFDVLTNEVLNRGNGKQLLIQAYQEGVEVCRKRYAKVFDERGVKNLLKHAVGNLNNRNRYALEKLYVLRDEIARKEDESANYILPNNVLVRLAEQLPSEPQIFLQNYQVPISRIPKYIEQIREIVKQALLLPLFGASGGVPVFGMRPFAMESHLITKRSEMIHDYSHHPEIRNDLSTLLDGTEVVKVEDGEQNSRLNILWKDFDEPTNNPVIDLKFVSPYERYKRTLQFEHEKSTEDLKEIDAKRKSPKRMRN